VKGLVLLKNDGVLPLARGGRLAVIGPMADDRVDMQGTWAIDVDPRDSVTVLDGIRAAAGNTHVLEARGCNIVDDVNLAARLNVHNRDNPSVVIDARAPAEMIAEAVAVAQESDAIVLCLGEAKEHAGESSTRLDIALPGEQQALFDALRAVGKPLVVVAIAGRPLALTGVRAADALIWTGHPGAQGGHAIAEVLFGDQNPSGRLCMALPRHVGQLPLATEELPTGRPIEAIGVDVGGDSEVDAAGQRVFRKFTTACRLEGPHTALYPFGHGLSYTRFEYRDLQLLAAPRGGEQATLQFSVTLHNVGTRTGTEVVQVYVSDPVASRSRPQRELKAFRRVTLAAGQQSTLHFELPAALLGFCRAPSLLQPEPVFEPGSFVVYVGGSSLAALSLDVDWQAG